MVVGITNIFLWPPIVIIKGHQARLGKHELHPISPTTPAPQCHPIHTDRSV